MTAMMGASSFDPTTKCGECGHDNWHHEQSGNGSIIVDDHGAYFEGTCNVGVRFDSRTDEFPETCYCPGFRNPTQPPPGDWESATQTKGINMAETALVEGEAPTDSTTEATKPRYVLKDGHEYVPRPLAGFENDVEGLRWLIANGKHVILLGPPGCGKTALVEAAFPDAENEIMHSRMTAFDMKWLARPVIMENGTTGVVFDPAPLTRAALGGHIVYVDELMRGGDDAFTPLFSAMDGRNIIIGGNQDGTDLEIKPGFGVIAASNPMVRGAFLPDAIASRFFILEVATSKSLLERMKINSDLITIWSNLGEQKKGECWQPSIRDLRTAQAFLDAGNKHAAAYALTGYRVPEVDREVVAGVVGLSLGVRVGKDGGVIK